MLDLKHGYITGIPFTKYGNRIIYFLHNSSRKTGWRRDIFFFTLLHHNITCFKLYLCYNLIIVCYPAGRPSSWGTAMPYVTPHPTNPPLISSPPSFLCMFMLVMCQNTSACLPSFPSPLSRVTSLPFVLCKDTELGSRALKIHICLGWSSS